MSAREILRIGTRGSALALYQANRVSRALNNAGVESEIRIIKTLGDKADQTPFSELPGKSFFTKEIEDALLAVEIDVAVHSLKDLTTDQPDGLKLAAVGFRADRRELLIMRRGLRAESGPLPLPAGCLVGTGSKRRESQIVRHVPAVRIADLRGNVPTRVDKLRQGKYDAIVLAAAGADRLELELSDLDVRRLDPELFLPSPGQGIIGMQIRSGDDRTAACVEPLSDPADEAEAQLERGLLARFDSGCSLPLGVFSQVDGSRLRLKAVLGEQDPETGHWVNWRDADVVGGRTEDVVAATYELLTNP